MKKRIMSIFICMILITVASLFTSLGKVVQDVPRSPLCQTNLNADWTEGQKLLASDGSNGNAFGYSVSVSGDTLLIGSCYDDDHGTMCGSAYVFVRTEGTWTQQQKLLASDGAAFDYFGNTVSLDGDTALIGAHGDNGYIGSAYVFVRTGTTWTQQQKLTASDGGADDWFGYSVSLSDDTAAIGAHGDNGYTGAVYVFTRSGTAWSEQQKLLASDGGSLDSFGYSVSVDGDTALIGAHWDNDYQGSAYVFVRAGTTWTEQQKLISSDGVSWDYFGWSVSLSGESALIGAMFDDDNGTDSGSAYIYTRSGTTWVEEGKIIAFDGAGNDQFGGSVILDGDTAVVGAWADDDSGSDSGSAYVFIRTGTTWTQEDKLTASDGEMDYQFGSSVALEGNRALIGCPGYENFIGAVYEYTKESINEPPVALFSWSPQDPLVNQSILFDASASYDSDGAITTYEWDWDNDGMFDEISASATTTHSWAEPGSYPVTICVIDDEDATGMLTKILSVNGTVNLSVEITGGIGITTTITNDGTVDADNISWVIHGEGGLLGRINATITGTDDIPAGESVTLEKLTMFGLGPITVIVQYDDKETTVSGFLFLFLVIQIH